MVLGGDEAFVASGHPHRLVVAAMAVFQLEGVGTRGPGQQLVPHADAEDGLVFLHGLPEVPHRGLTQFRVAGAIGDEQPVVFKCVEVVVPRYPYQADAPFYEAAQDIVFHSAVDQHHCFVAVSVTYCLRAAYQRHLVLGIGVGDGEIPAGAMRLDDAGHRAFFAQGLREGPGVYAVDTGYVLFLEPGVQALHSVEMAVGFRIVADDKAPCPDALRLEVAADAVFVGFFGRYPVIAYERIAYTENLAAVRRVGKTFGVTHHGGREHEFSISRGCIPETVAFEYMAVREFEPCFQPVHNTLLLNIYANICKIIQKQRKIMRIFYSAKTISSNR